MSETNRFERMLRWYPPHWRSKYAEGMTALLEDTYGAGRVPLTVRLSLVKTGSMERAREVGFIGSATSPHERARAGSLLVLCGWGAFMIAGAIFAKFTDNWGASQLGGAHRGFVTALYGLVQWAGVAGAIVVLSAAILVVPSLRRLLAGGDWISVRQPMRRAFVAVAFIVASAAVIVTWAHFLSYHERNGGLAVYGYVLGAWSLAVSVAVGVVTSAAVSVARRLDLSRRTVQWLSTMAVVLTSIMFVTLAAMVAWWSIESVRAPVFMRNGIGNGLFYTSSEFPLALIVASLLMGVGLCAAIGGAVRVVRARRDETAFA
jgi:MFS family permease